MNDTSPDFKVINGEASDIAEETPDYAEMEQVEARPDPAEEMNVDQWIGDFRVPAGFEVWASGVYEIKSYEGGESSQLDGGKANINVYPNKARRMQLQRISDRPVWIKGFGNAIDTGEELVCLGFHKIEDRTEAEVWVTRVQLSDRRQMESLAREGLPIRTGNAQAMEHYLSRCIGENGPRFSWRTSAQRCGMYRRPGKTIGFLIGKDWIGPDPEVVLDSRIDNDFYKGLRTNGSLDAWLEKFSAVSAQNDYCHFLCHSTFTAPIMRLIRQRSFIIHHFSRSGAGKCLGAGSLVNTGGGLARIEELDRGFPEGFTQAYRKLPKLWDGEQAVRARAFYKEHNAETVRVTTVSGTSFTCTPEHPVMTEAGWVEARNLTTEHRIRCVTPRFNPSRVKRFDGRGLTIPFAELLGILVADGSCGYDRQLKLSSDPEVLRLAVARLTSETPYGSVRFDSERELGIHGGIPMRNWFRDAGLPIDLAAGKVVPSSILGANREAIAGFLRGYFECEGYFDPGHIEVVSASQQLAQEVKLLLRGFGIRATLREKRVVGYDQSYWRLTISGAEQVLQFAREISLMTPTRLQQLGLAAVSGLRRASPPQALEDWDPVSTVQPDRRQTVYDFTVPVTHQFAANGLLNHNTALLRFGMSAWGDPQDLTASLNTTAIAATEIFRYVDNLPIAYDELQASTSKDHAQLIYHFVQERGRRRARRNGGLEAEVNTWRTMVRTTGEEELVGNGKVDLGGQKNRVIEINAKALTSEEAREIHHWLEEGHYGHAGRAFLRALTGAVNVDESFVDRLYKLYRQYSMRLKEEVPGLDARSDPMAAVILTSRLVDAWLLGRDPEEAEAEAFQAALTVARGAVEDEDQECIVDKALSVLREHYMSNPTSWINLDTPDGIASLNSQQYRGLVGVFCPTGMGDDHRYAQEVWLVPSAANALLSHADISWRGVWLDLRKSGELEKLGTKRPFGQDALGQRRWRKCYALKLSKFFGSSLMGPEE